MLTNLQRDFTQINWSAQFGKLWKLKILIERRRLLVAIFFSVTLLSAILDVSHHWKSQDGCNTINDGHTQQTLNCDKFLVSMATLEVEILPEVKKMAEMSTTVNNRDMQQILNSQKYGTSFHDRNGILRPLNAPLLNEGQP